MRIHIFHTKAEESTLKGVLRETATHPGAYSGYTLHEDGDRFTFTQVACDPAHSFTLRVKKGMVWATDRGFIFATSTLLLSRINFNHDERDFKNKRGVSVAFARAA